MATSANNLAERIMAARKKARMSREKVAQGLDMSSRTVERWEKGETQPGDEELELLAEVLGANPSWLLTGEGEMLVGNPPRRIQATDETPTRESSKTRIGAAGVGGYTPGEVRTITIDPSEDMTYPTAWVVPILTSAQSAVMNREDYERARILYEKGERFIVRLTIEEGGPRTSEEPPPPKG